MKKGIIIILAILLTIGAGLSIPLLMHSDADSSIRERPGEVALETRTPVATSTTNASEGIRFETPSGKPTPEVSKEPEESAKNGVGTTPVPSNPVISPRTAEVNTGKPTSTPEVTEEPNVEPTPTATKPNIAESWVERKIREHRDEIDSDDLADFRRIYSRVDIVYVQGLMDDGLDNEEMTQLKSYLRRTLGGDYERAKELFYEYSYLIAEV